MSIHYARIEESPRLQRLLNYLLDGKPHTTMDIIHNAQITNASTGKAELIRNFKRDDLEGTGFSFIKGYNIICTPQGRNNGSNVYVYKLVMPGQQSLTLK